MPENDKVHLIVQSYPATTRRIMELYLSEASLEEKEMITKAVQGAAKIITTLKKEEATLKKEEEPKARKSKVVGVPTPEAVAIALYSVLSETPSTKVSGKPSEDGYTRTLIEGQFDLNEVARKLLLLGSGQASKEDWL